MENMVKVISEQKACKLNNLNCQKNSITLNVDNFIIESNSYENKLICDSDDSIDISEIVHSISEPLFNVEENSNEKQNESDEILQILSKNSAIKMPSVSTTNLVKKPTNIIRTNSTRTVSLTGRVITNSDKNVINNCEHSLERNFSKKKGMLSCMNVNSNMSIVPERVSNPLMKREKSCFVTVRDE